MRIATFFLYLFFHLLGGVNSVHAPLQNSNVASCPQSLIPINDQQKYVQSVPKAISLTTAEFDLEEELSNGNSFKTNTVLTDGKFHLSQAWYLSFSCQFIPNQLYKRLKIFASSCGQSNPIYILQQVLRI